MKTVNAAPAGRHQVVELAVTIDVTETYRVETESVARDATRERAKQMSILS